ncbi:MAG TPA: capsule assembly Wzi family protein [Puia sp.]
MKNTLLLLLLLYGGGLMAQPLELPSLWHASAEAQGVLTTKDNVPFWMRSNQWGSVPLPGASGSLIGSVRKDYNDGPRTANERDIERGLRNIRDFDNDRRGVDWGMGLEVRGDLGAQSRARIIEAYLKVRWSIFQLRAGRYRQITGLVDSTLSSGSFTVSGNALPIPSIEGSIPDWWSLPVFNGLFAIKGNFSHGWLGNQAVQDSTLIRYYPTYFHQSSLYGRLGRPDWAFKLYAGFSHEAFWGSEKAHDPKFGLSPWKTFQYVALGKTYRGSKIGNHLGSIDIGGEYETGNVRIFLYHQFFYDVGALAHLANLNDGLTGLSLTNKQEDDGYFHWNKIVFELFYSKDQAGYPWSKRTPSGDEDYYNNFLYADGWSYKGQGLGNPFITPAYTTRTGLPKQPADYFNNNRVVALYAAFDCSFGDYGLTTRWSWSQNFGTFGTSPWGYSTGSRFVPPRFGLFPQSNQVSGYLELTRTFSDGWRAGVAGGLDNGRLFNNSAGFILKLSKSI